MAETRAGFFTSGEATRAGSVTTTRILYFANRNLAHTGQAVFMLGLVFVAGKGSSGAGLSSVFIAMMAAALVCGLPAGAIADRLGSPRALLAGATGRGLMIALALLLPAGPASLAIVAFGYSAVSQLFSPAELSMVPYISKDRPAGVHAMLNALQYAGQALGIGVIAPLAYWLGGPEMVLQAALAIYVLVVTTSALLSVRVPVPERVTTARETFSFMGPVRYFTSGTSACYAGLILAFGDLASKSLYVALPVYLSHELALEKHEQLLFFVPAGIGVVSGLLWGTRSLRIHRAVPVMRTALICSVTGLVSLSYLGPVVAGLAGSTDISLLSTLDSSRGVSALIITPVGLLLGFCFTLTPIAGRTIISSTAPQGQQGRVFAMQGMFSDLVTIVPLALTGLSAEMIGTRSTFLFVGAVGLALLIALELTKIGKVPHLHLPMPEVPVGHSTTPAV